MKENKEHTAHTKNVSEKPSPEADLLDGVVAIKNALGELKGPAASVQAIFEGRPSASKKRPEKPLVRSTACSCVRAHTTKACDACVKSCPVKAVQTAKEAVRISSDCVGCGLCVEACPTGALTTARLEPTHVLREVLMRAYAYTTCYMTCEKAGIDASFAPNVSIFPTLGAIPFEVFSAILLEVSNFHIYQPLQACEACEFRDQCEQALLSSVQKAEKIALTSPVLVTEETDIVTERRRDLERAEFVMELTSAVDRLLPSNTPQKPVTSYATLWCDEYFAGFLHYKKCFIEAYGKKNKEDALFCPSQRKLLLGYALSRAYATKRLASTAKTLIPHVTEEFCTLCGACKETCFSRALAFTEDMRLALHAPYCASCGACIQVCPQNALSYVEKEITDLYLLPIDLDAEGA